MIPPFLLPPPPPFLPLLLLFFVFVVFLLLLLLLVIIIFGFFICCWNAFTQSSYWMNKSYVSCCCCCCCCSSSTTTRYVSKCLSCWSYDYFLCCVVTLEACRNRSHNSARVKGSRLSAYLWNCKIARFEHKCSVYCVGVATLPLVGWLWRIRWKILVIVIV